MIDKEIVLLEQCAGLFEGNGNLVMTEYLADAYFRKAKVGEAQAETCYSMALNLLLLMYEQGYE